VIHLRAAVAAVEPVNRLVQVPEPGRVDAVVGVGHRGDLEKQTATAMPDGTAKALHFQAFKYAKSQFNHRTNMWWKMGSDRPILFNNATAQRPHRRKKNAPEQEVLFA
jgi:hypothetical protein